ncbi:hypothetical protein KKC45_03725, partial [Patescibacteria group bacterium]|nr:hypothetical protein [Patescibacteria group bacterium]
INLNINYSLDYEKKRIKYTLDKADWFIKNGYSKWIKLPEGKKLDEIEINEATEKYLIDKVDEEYNKDDYASTKDIINKQWFKFTPKLEKYFDETSLNKENVYNIQLTKYGVGGSYNLPNNVILNFKNKSELSLFKIPVHEIIHLSIQPFIDEYDVDHWIKERIVDSILEKIAPELNTMQKVPIETKNIDESFEKHYPNIEEVIKNI